MTDTIQQLTQSLAPQRNGPDFDNLWEELRWRGLVHVSTDEEKIAESLAGQPLTYYCGFDPTAPSLHLGNLVQLLTMRRLQLSGHRPLVLVGGSTGLIGDPRPTAERILNSKETVAQWVERLEGQIRKFLSFGGDAQYQGANAARIVNNMDWTQSLGTIDFLRDVGKYFRVGSMVKKDAVATRLNSETGISYTEFSYQVLQGMDYLQLYRRYGCTLQTGGSDQWGNLVGGVELIHKAEGATVHALGTPLITNSDGTKFGKSEGNAIWLDGAMASPYLMYQFWLNTADADVLERLKVFTFIDRGTINGIAEESAKRPHERLAQKILAFQATATVHGEEAVRRVIAASAVLFGGTAVAAVDADTFEAVTQQLERTELPRAELESGATLLRAVMVQSGLAATASEARRTIKEGGVYVNGVKAKDENAVLGVQDLVADAFIIVRRGKKKQIAVKAV